MQAIKNKVIYLVDDDEDDRMLFLDAVDQLGHPVSVVEIASGDALLELLEGEAERLPELIFMDINMPGRNGLKCLELIRRGKAFSGVKIVMLSTSSSVSNIDLSYELGADLYAVKPNTFQRLKSLLDEILSLGRESFGRERSEFLKFFL